MGKSLRGVNWADRGVPADIARQLQTTRRAPGCFTYDRELALWERWVGELESGVLWVSEDFEAALAARDDIDLSLAVMPSHLREPVLDWVDFMDGKYIRWTVASPVFGHERMSSRWWWARVPLRNAQRLHLFVVRYSELDSESYKEVEMGKNDRHVVKNPKGGWDVKKPGADRSSAHEKTQADAERTAKKIVGNAGGGEVVIHRPDGKIRDKDTVAPGNDPNPPKDTKH